MRTILTFLGGIAVGILAVAGLQALSDDNTEMTLEIDQTCSESEPEREEVQEQMSPIKEVDA